MLSAVHRLTTADGFRRTVRQGRRAGSPTLVVHLWVDPDAGAACIALTDRDFGPWAVEAWTPFSDGVRAELSQRA